MIIELGHFALILALAVALLQMLLPAWGARIGDARLMAVAPPAALAQLTLLAFAFLSLTHAFLTSDFSVEAVWANSHTAKPLIYKFSGVWGNHEGSMLLWVLILASFGAAVALFGGNLPDSLRANVLAVQAAIAVCFLVFIVFASSPFARIPAQASGRTVAEPPAPTATRGTALGTLFTASVQVRDHSDCSASQVQWTLGLAGLLPRPCYSDSALYKTQFAGFEFFNGARWSENLGELKSILQRQQQSELKQHLLEDEAYRAAFLGDELPALAAQSLFRR